jgi:8-hydroxy-5-deazaflavin:NADPH oxidoreductase
MNQNICILGTGGVAKALAILLNHAGFTPVLGSRSPESAPDDLRSIARVATHQEAVSFSDVIILAMPFSQDAITYLAGLSSLESKIIVDAMNPLKSDWSPLVLGVDTSSGEEVQKALSRSHVVKAFNTIFADMMSIERLAAAPIKPAGFLCGNSTDAKAVVSDILARIGFDPVDVGSILCARYLEAMAHLNISIAVKMKGGTQAFFSYTQKKG